MKAIKTVKFKITSHTKTFDDTIEIYRKALSFYIKVFNENWDVFRDLKSYERMRLAEKLTHRTKKNPIVRNDFDTEFIKFPPYFRRSTIMAAAGAVSSYESNYEKWLALRRNNTLNGKRTRIKPPILQLKHNKFPVFYKKDMFEKHSDNHARIKIFKDNDWKWITIMFNSKDLKNRDLNNYKELNPTLVKQGKKYFLHIPYQKIIKIQKTPNIDKRIVVGVDLGLTKSAVCSALKSDGTVIGRCFIDQPIEKNRLNKVLHKLSKVNRRTEKANNPNYWRKINCLQKMITQDTVNRIVGFAEKHQASVITFEKLEKFRVPRYFYGAAKLRTKLQYWAKRRIQRKTEQKALLKSINVSYVTSRNTSKLAFDGSGEVKRNGKKDICIFKTGKIYHSDLNASYNIGARYFIREIIKSLSEKVRSELQAKVPEALVRTRQTLASLIRLQEVLEVIPLKSSVSCIQVKGALTVDSPSLSLVDVQGRDSVAGLKSSFNNSYAALTIREHAGQNLRVSVVYVLNKRGFLLMPCSPRKARVLLIEGGAKVVKRIPFTIQLLAATGEATHSVTFGVDIGYMHIGLLAVTDVKEITLLENARTLLIDFNNHAMSGGI